MPYPRTRKRDAEDLADDGDEGAPVQADVEAVRIKAELNDDERYEFDLHGYAYFDYVKMTPVTMCMHKVLR